MTDIAIRVEDLGKQYRIGVLEKNGGRYNYKSLRDSIANAASAPFRAVRSLAGRNGTQTTRRDDTIWALKDVSFEVKRGDIVGVIGRNGTGKSTLLKVLSRITEPTTGRVEIHGRVGSLLEVGTGFHPELTGRDNVYMNGAILGMKRAQIARQFDAIVAFAEVEKFIDTPVKHYSSGMYLRLAFAVAAHLESEILIVDEVLAVGDVQFQKKCLGKMQDVSRGGRTVIFVSHNMPTVMQLTTRAIMLHEGRIKFTGSTHEVVSKYTSSTGGVAATFFDVEHKPRQYAGTGAARILSLWFDRSIAIFQADEDFEFIIAIRADEEIPRLRVSMTVFAADGAPVGSCFGRHFSSFLPGQRCVASIGLPSPGFAPGRYFCGIAIGRGDNTSGHIDFDVVLQTLDFEVLPAVGDGGAVSAWNPGWGHTRFQTLRQSIVSSPEVFLPNV